ncbi:hypothetical protein [Cupriavidus sp. D39]|uniref:hypothetical protein n=1 Tax=Cupriavidus sp. D39 TaxID=2997877 RepID=UPI00226E61E8|nr:hypothetical protein [Cupriavidus sp. D39]MCY0856433.1 hypothetical protein [Cupriavidus sp. D39]
MKAIGRAAFVLVFLVGVIAVGLLAIKGVAWAATTWLPALIKAGWLVLAVDVLILLPLSIFKRLRGFTGGGIFASSYLFGLITFLMGFVTTWMLWGKWAVIVGILMFGGAVVPFALLAALFDGMWGLFATLLSLCALTFGAKLVAVMLWESRPAPDTIDA